MSKPGAKLTALLLVPVIAASLLGAGWFAFVSTGAYGKEFGAALAGAAFLLVSIANSLWASAGETLDNAPLEAGYQRCALCCKPSLEAQGKWRKLVGNVTADGIDSERGFICKACSWAGVRNWCIVVLLLFSTPFLIAGYVHFFGR
jgi:hypothetical protein